MSTLAATASGGGRGAKRVLLLCPHPVGVAPGQRLKYEQYFDFLKGHGFEITVSPFMTRAFWDIVYKPGHVLLKVFWTMVGYARRVRDILRLPFYDGVYVCLWVTPFGSTLFERACRGLAARMIYDIDDLVYLGRASAANPLVALLKGRSKVRFLARTADQVITCTPYLDAHVRQWTANTTDISSTVDTRVYRPRARYANDHRLVLGWSGSHSTAPYLHLLDAVLRELCPRRDCRLSVIGEPSFRIEGLEVEAIPWRLETEVQDLGRIDIGLYPLPDDLWVQGKSGLKAIQYMAMGIPPIATDIGANRRVIEDGVSGFLVRTEEDWKRRIIELAADPDLRRRIGAAARARVERLFSVEANQPRYLEVFNKAYGAAGGGDQPPNDR